MSYLPALLMVAGTMVAAAGLLVIVSHRRRSLVPVGALLLLAGVIIAAPATVLGAARTAVEATGATVSHTLPKLLHHHRTSSPELVATDTGDTP